MGLAGEGLLVRASASVLREIASVCVCWDGCLEQDLQDNFGFSGWGSQARVCSDEWLRVFYERSRAFVTCICVSGIRAWQFGESLLAQAGHRAYFYDFFRNY